MNTSITDPDSQLAGQIQGWSKALAGALVAHGVVAQTDVGLYSQLIAGTLVFGASLAWSIIDRKKMTRLIEVAPTLPPDSPRPAVIAAASTPSVSTLLASVQALSDDDKRAIAAALAPHFESRV